MDVLTKKQTLSRRTAEDLIQRSESGIYLHPLAMTVACLTTGLAQRLPVTAMLAVGSLFLLSIARFLIVRRLQRKSLKRIDAWSRLHLGLLLASSTVWGVFPGVALWRFGYQDKDVTLLLLYHAVLVSATVLVLKHDRRFILASMVLMIAPPIIGHLLFRGPSPMAYICAVTLFCVYSFLQGTRLHEQYKDQISDNYDLSIAAFRDCLTGLPNRLYMNESLDHWVEDADRGQHQIALLYIDLDGFKQINDQHSHKMGDLFLCEASARMCGCLRSRDVLARIGGDEFAILMPECVSEHDAIGLANRILTTARAPLDIDGKRLSYSASIGVSFYPGCSDSIERLLRTADEAMYMAKTAGKDQICIASTAYGKKMLAAKEAPVLDRPLASSCHA